MRRLRLYGLVTVIRQRTSSAEGLQVVALYHNKVVWMAGANINRFVSLRQVRNPNTLLFLGVLKRSGTIGAY